MSRPAPRRGPALRVQLLFLGLALLLGLCIAELSVRRFVPVRNVGPSFTVYDPVYGKVLKKSFHCTRSAPEFSMTFTTNSLGFRGREPESFPRHALLFLGDSLTMGHGVDDGEVFTEIVDDALAEQLAPGKLPVINAGLGNSGNGRWIKFLRREAAAFDPRMVVLEVCSNDVDDNWNERLFTLDERGGLVESPSVPGASWKRHAQQIVDAIPGLAYSHLVSMMREERRRAPPAEVLAADGSPTSDPAKPNVQEALTLRLVEESLSICAERGWPTLVVTANLGDRDDRFASLLADLCVRRRVRTIRIPLRTERPDLYFEIDRHWTPAGHVFVAHEVLAALQGFPELLSGSR